MKALPDGRFSRIYDQVTHIAGSATEGERVALSVFLRRYNGKLGSVDSFLQAVEGEPYIKKILYKLGFQGAFEGTGTEAEKEGRRALSFIMSTISAVEQSDRSTSILQESAHLAIGDKEIREVSREEIEGKLDEAKKRVLDSDRKSYNLSAQVASAKSSPGDSLATNSTRYSLRDKVGKSVGDTEDLFNFKGLIQASTDQKTAADIMLVAANLQLINSRPDPIRNPQAYVEYLGKMSAAQAAITKIGGTTP